MSFSVVPTSLVILAMWSTAELLPIRFGPRRRQWGEFQCLIAKSNCVIITFCNFIMREVLVFSMRLCFGSYIISIRSNKGLINIFSERSKVGLNLCKYFQVYFCIRELFICVLYRTLLSQLSPSIVLYPLTFD